MENIYLDNFYSNNNLNSPSSNLQSLSEISESNKAINFQDLSKIYHFIPHATTCTPDEKRNEQELTCTPSSGYHSTTRAQFNDQNVSFSSNDDGYPPISKTTFSIKHETLDHIPTEVDTGNQQRFCYKIRNLQFLNPKNINQMKIYDDDTVSFTNIILPANKKMLIVRVSDASNFIPYYQALELFECEELSDENNVQQYLQKELQQILVFHLVKVGCPEWCSNIRRCVNLKNICALCKFNKMEIWSHF